MILNPFPDLIAEFRIGQDLRGFLPRLELFFKWIKQHLRIKRFYGTSPNSVKTQVWIAVAVYVLVAIMKKRLGLPHSLYTILQVLSLTLFEKTPISSVFSRIDDSLPPEVPCNQLMLFEN